MSGEGRKFENRAGLSIREFSAALGVSIDHTRRQIEAGNVKAVRFGKRVIIPVTEMERVLADT